MLVQGPKDRVKIRILQHVGSGIPVVGPQNQNVRSLCVYVALWAPVASFPNVLAPWCFGMTLHAVLRGYKLPSRSRCGSIQRVQQNAAIWWPYASISTQLPKTIPSYEHFLHRNLRNLKVGLGPVGSLVRVRDHFKGDTEREG